MSLYVCVNETSAQNIALCPLQPLVEGWDGNGPQQTSDSLPPIPRVGLVVVLPD